MQQMDKDSVMTNISHNVTDFSQEIGHFRQKYGQSLEECKAAYEASDENFEQYDDLMAWEFAEQGKAYWEKQISETGS